MVIATSDSREKRRMPEVLDISGGAKYGGDSSNISHYVNRRRKVRREARNPWVRSLRLNRGTRMFVAPRAS
jgi:hypothetical protein